MTLSCLELYCGIGGFAAAAQLQGDALSVIAAVDIDCGALEVYRSNFPSHPTVAAEIRSLDINRFPADLWWLSPPCLPFTRKGKQLDADDPRTASLIALINKITPQAAGPRFIAIENVPPFAASQTGRWIEQRLREHGYQTAWEIRCPTEFGVPMRRSRCFLLASREGLRPLRPVPEAVQSLRSFLEPTNDADPKWAVPATWLTDYAAAIDRVDPAQDRAVASCFTSSYSRMPVRSGSYIQLDRNDPLAARFFAPEEILRLLGFPTPWHWPPALSLRRRYAMAGNSVHVATVARVLSRLID